MSSEATAKRQKSSKDVPYHLIYWPGIPGRGEHIRLALEQGGATYTDTAHIENGANEVLSYVTGAAPTDDGLNIPVRAPPILKHGDLVISQTSNILLYLGPKLGLVPIADEDGDGNEDGVYKVNELVLTALDGLSDEPHNVHHPIATGLYFEDQLEEAKRAATEYVRERLPKFLGYFERVLASKASGAGPWLVGGKVTCADLVLFQCVAGVKFMFPKATAKLLKDGKFPKVFAHSEAVRELPRIKAYLESDRRQAFSPNGIYRNYEQLDIEC